MLTDIAIALWGAGVFMTVLMLMLAGAFVVSAIILVLMLEEL